MSEDSVWPPQIVERSAHTQMIESNRLDILRQASSSTDAPCRSTRMGHASKDLSSGRDIELRTCLDLVVAVSSGRLLNGLTAHHMRAGCLCTCNELPEDVMPDCCYLGQTGISVLLRMVRDMPEHNGIAPDLFEENRLFTIMRRRGAQAEKR